MNKLSLINKYRPLVHKLAFKFYMSQSFPYVEKGDLVSAGYVGILKAQKKFNPKKAQFLTYAYRKIIKEIRAELIRWNPYIGAKASVRRTETRRRHQKKYGFNVLEFDATKELQVASSIKFIDDKSLFNFSAEGNQEIASEINLFRGRVFDALNKIEDKKIRSRWNRFLAGSDLKDIAKDDGVRPDRISKALSDTAHSDEVLLIAWKAQRNIQGQSKR